VSEDAPPPACNVQYQGYVGGFLLASFITWVAVLGPIGLAVVFMLDLEINNSALEAVLTLAVGATWTFALPHGATNTWRCSKS